jgi:outer membrane immunogenic protein
MFWLWYICNRLLGVVVLSFAKALCGSNVGAKSAMKKFVVGAAALAAIAVSAGSKPTLAEGRFTPAYNWTGAFAGINAGGGWMRDSEGVIDHNSSNPNGFLIGGTLGYNFQANGPWVWGIEGDLGYYTHRDIKYLGTVRGRVGYATGQLLPYFTGGVAFAHDETATTGWTLGGGLEYAISRNLSVKAEYLYVDALPHLTGSFVRGGLNWRF